MNDNILIPSPRLHHHHEDQFPVLMSSHCSQEKVAWKQVCTQLKQEWEKQNQYEVTHAIGGVELDSQRVTLSFTTPPLATEPSWALGGVLTLGCRHTCTHSPHAMQVYPTPQIFHRYAPLLHTCAHTKNIENTLPYNTHIYHTVYCTYMHTYYHYKIIPHHIHVLWAQIHANIHIRRGYVPLQTIHTNIMKI